MVDDLHPWLWLRGTFLTDIPALLLLLFLSSTLIEAGAPPGDHLGLLTDHQNLQPSLGL